MSTSRTPYMGLIPYSEEDAPFFFGRERESRLVVANLHASALTLFYGASGVGKSSVLRAGVTRMLRDREDLLVVVFNSWQGNPARDLMRAVAACAERADRDAWSRTAPMVQDSSIPLSEFLTTCARELNRRLMIILDQFEEYFLYHSQDDEFADEFPRVVNQSDAPVSFLISTREDALAKLDRFEGRIRSLFDNYLRIEHLDRVAAEVAITKPIEQYNLLHKSAPPFRIQPELVNLVLNQVQTGQVILGESGRGQARALDVQSQIETPFLQMVMARLWQEAINDGSHDLRLQTLVDLGGAERIVLSHLDEVMDALSAEERDISANVFRYLVTPSGTKIAYSASDLAGLTMLDPVKVANVLSSLSSGDVRIVRSIDPAVTREGAEVRYEVFHDVLALAVLDWRARYMQTMRSQREKEMAASETRAIEQARFARYIGRMIAVAAVLLLLAVGAAAFAVFQFRQARESEGRARAGEERAQAERHNADIQSGRADEQTNLANQNLNNARREKENADEAFATAQAAELQANAEATRARQLLDLAGKASQRADAAGKISQLSIEAFNLSDDGEPEEAIKKYREALAIAETIKDRTRQASILRTLGLLLVDNPPESIATYERARVLYQQGGDLTSEADTLIQMGNVFHGRYPERPKALTYYERALALYRQTKNQSAEIETLEKIAGTYSATFGVAADLRKSIEVYELVLVLYNQSGNYEGEADTLEKLGDVHARLVQGRRESAAKRIEFYKRSAAVYRRAGDLKKEAFTWRVMTNFLHNLDDPNWEIEILKQQLPVYELMKSTEDAAKIIAAIADITYERLKKKEEALDYLERARKGFQESGHISAQGLIVRTIGGLYFISKQEQKAIPFYEEAAALFKRAENRREEEITQAFIGRIYSQLGDRNRAIEFYEKARALFDQSSEMRPYHKDILEQLIGLYEQTGAAAKADAARQDLETLRRTPSP